MKPVITTCLLATSLLSLPSAAASLDDPVLQRGEEVYRQTCATSYCHGPNGAAAGAPRLASRGFDEAYIAAITGNGVPDTQMAAFGGALSQGDFTAVLTYVASLNGILNPDFGSDDPLASLGIEVPNPLRIPLTGTAQQGRELFFDTWDKGVNRCSTCHEMEGVGLPVATAIRDVPASVQALRELDTPSVQTLRVEGESMPALLLSQGVTGTIFYDLGSVLPVMRTLPPGTAHTLEAGSGWQHAQAIERYSDEEAEAVLAFLRAISE